MTERGPDEDELWRSIVDNYGDRAELSSAEIDEIRPPEEPPAPDYFVADESFRPPDPPPVPRPQGVRLWAWLGLLGTPVLLFLTAAFLLPVPAPLIYISVAWFVGGFVYLILTLPPRPSDFDDDGARI